MKAVVVKPLNEEAYLALEERVFAEKKEWKRKKVGIRWSKGELEISHPLFFMVKSSNQVQSAYDNARARVSEVLEGFEEGVDYEVSVR